MTFGITLFVLAGASGYVAESIVALFVGRAFLGVAVSCLMVSGTTIVGQLFAPDRRGRVLGLQGAAAAAGGVAFLTLGGRLAEIDWKLPFLVYLAGLIILPFVLSLCPAAHANAPKAEGTSLPRRCCQSLRSGLRR